MDLFNDLAGRMTSQGQISIVEFLLCLVGAGALSGILTFSYIRFGRSLSNRKAFAANFIPITLTTMFIISVVKSSLALSLGLVGALSIVRFRTAIREPEELIYLFVCIALGLGFGASQWKISLIAFAAIVGVLLILSIRFRKSQQGLGLMLVLQKSAKSPDESVSFDLAKIQSALSGIANRTAVTRIDSSDRHYEAALILEGMDSTRLPDVLSACRQIDPALRCLVVDSSGRAMES
jgi:hypothetical protein